MSLDLAILASDLRQVRKDLPVSFRFRGARYEDGSFNPGVAGYEAIAGGVIEDPGTATLMYNLADLRVRKPPEMNEEIEVLWHGRWLKYEIQDFTAGFVSATFTLKSPEKP